jgi:hypothetical protein
VKILSTSVYVNHYIGVLESLSPTLQWTRALHNAHPLLQLPRTAIRILAYKHTRLILLTREVNRRIPIKEITRLEMHLVYLNRHDWPVLYSRVVRESKRVPHYHVLVDNLVFPRNHVMYAALLDLAL